MTWSCSLCFKVITVETESANSDQDQPTLIPDQNTGTDFMVFIRSISWKDPSGPSRNFTIVRQYASDGDNLRLFDYKANLMSAGSSNIYSNYLDTVLPDFKLFTASF